MPISTSTDRYLQEYCGSVTKDLVFVAPSIDYGRRGFHVFSSIYQAFVVRHDLHLIRGIEIRLTMRTDFKATIRRN